VPDVFVSFTRTGHPELAEKIEDLLTPEMSVFLDKSVPVGDAISDRIPQALADSRLMVVVYSASYVTRWACQWELIQAVLAGAAEGDPAGRVLVVNPEPGGRHIVPAAVADSMYLRADDLPRLKDAVRRRLERLPGPMAAIRPPLEQPRWLPPTVPGAQGFVGRFADLWSLHDALTGVERPLTFSSPGGPVAVVTGMAGIGKSSLVRAYAHLFGAAHRGGVYWTRVGGPGGVDAARLRFDQQVRALAGADGLPIAGENAARLRVLLAEHLDRSGQPFLWVVDDLPPDLDGDVLDDFVLPSRFARPVFLTQRAGALPGRRTVALGGLAVADALRLLRRERTIVEADRPIAESLIARLGGHPLALNAVAVELRDYEGRGSYRDAVEQITSRRPDVVAVIGQSMRSLDSRALALAALAGLLAPAPVPAAVFAGIEADPDTGSLVGGLDALRELRRHGFARQDGPTWQIHPLVVDAAASLGPPPVPPERLGTAAARTLAALLTEAVEAYAPETALLAQHAAALADSGHGDVQRALAVHYTRVGDAARAAFTWHRVASEHPDSVPDLIGYAVAGSANGEYPRAREFAGRAVDLATDPGSRARARWALAVASDGIAEFSDADRLWADLDRSDWTPPPGSTFRVSRARAHLARGQLRAARLLLEPLLADPPGEESHAARLEYARLLLLTGASRDARKLADDVVRWYRERGAPGHVRALEAEMIAAEATVTLDFFELKPDTARWAHAEARLAEVARSDSGPHSVTGLVAAVQHGLVLLRLGQQARCRAVLEPVLAPLATALGENHPIVLRARYVLASVHLQLNEYAQAEALLADVWDEQRRVLGPGHPETLASQLEYGVALKFSDSKRSRELITDAYRRLPDEVGRANDLYGRAWAARFLLPIMPAAFIRGLNRLEQLMQRWSTTRSPTR